MKSGAVLMKIGTVPLPFPTKIGTALSQLEVLQRSNVYPGVLQPTFASAALTTNLMGIGATGAAQELILAQPHPSPRTHVAIAFMKMSRADRSEDRNVQTLRFPGSVQATGHFW